MAKGVERSRLLAEVIGIEVRIDSLLLEEREIPWSEIDDLTVDEEGIAVLLSTGERCQYSFGTATVRERRRVAQALRERVMASILISVTGPEGTLVALRRDARGEVFTRISVAGEISEAGRRGAEALALRLAESAGVMDAPLRWSASPGSASPASFSATPTLG